MDRKKLLGALGVFVTVVGSIYHVIDPSVIPEKYSPIYAIIGTFLALVGKTPKKG